MTEQLVDFTCQICGGELEEKGDGVFRCRYCGKRWEKESVEDSEKMFETLEDALREHRRADLAALARRRYEETHKEFVSNAALEGICNQILNLNPEDFYARFYLATCKEDGSLESFLSSMDIAKHYYDIEDMLKFLIRGLKAGWINAVSTLIENAYKSRDLEKYNLYRTKFEEMAENVENGIFEPILPRDIFIAYSSRDMKEVNALVRVLEEENGLSCFVAARNLRHGSGAVENYRGAIHTALHNCKAMVFVSSTSSRNVKCEATMELGYIKEHLPKMWRIEFLVENYKGIPVERIFTSFFDGLEYCTSAQEVAGRYFDKYMGGQIDVDAARRDEEERIAKQKAEEARRKFEEETRRRLEAEFAAKLQAAKANTAKAAAETSADKKEAGQSLIAVLKAILAKKQQESTVKEKKTSPTLFATELLPGLFVEDGLLLKYNGNADKIVIPEGVNAIGELAFSNCSSLTSVIIPNSVTSIGFGAFYKCSSLTNVTIPNSVTYVGENTFQYCERLQTVYCEAPQKPTGWDSMWLRCPAKVIWGYKETSSTAQPKPAPAELPASPLSDFEIENGVLKKYKGKAEHVVTPTSVTAIYNYAFSYTKSLQSVVITGNVKSIGNYAFSSCANLKSVTIPNSVTHIGNNAFSHCTSLASINIPESITSINEATFFSCQALETVTIPNTVTSIGKNAFFLCKALPNITIPRSVTSIGAVAFQSCGALKNIVIPATVTAMGDSAFSSCNSLQTIYCEAAQQPKGWHKAWLGKLLLKCDAKVIWGYKG